MARTHHIRLEHDLLPREPEHEPVARHETVVAAAVAVERLALRVELVAVRLQHEPETLVREIHPREEPVVADPCLRLDREPRHTQCDGPERRLEGSGCPGVGGGEHASDLVALPQGQPRAPGQHRRRPQARSTCRVGDGQGVGER